MKICAHGYYAVCNDAGFILVSGTEAPDFLQSIVTANIKTLAVGDCRPAALLTPQGRILIDMIIYRQSEKQIYLQTDAARCGDLFARLRRYRLRRSVDLAVQNDMTAALWWGFTNNALQDDARIFDDPRHIDLGCRILIDGSPLPPTLDKVCPSSLENWHVRRITQAIPEGPIDLVPARALMLEAGLDKLGAVDFEKGCYIGQEVTARTFYRGLVKRRLVPIHIDGPTPPAHSDIIWQGRVIGSTKTAASFNNSPEQSVTLGLLKLSDIKAILAAKNETETVNKFYVRDSTASISLPTWMLPF
jgi:folate-binding protein YgfZ